MKKRWKYIALICAFAGLVFAGVAFVARIQNLRRDPARAFENATVRALPPPTVAKPTRRPTPPPGETPPPSDTPEPTQKPQIANQSGIVNLLVLGIDTSEERKSMRMGFRSDTIALCAVDLHNKSCSIIGVPRDTRAMVRRLDKNGRIVSENYDKINAAYAFGKDNGRHSHENAMRAIETLLGVSVDYYASIDLDGIRPIADAVGGVPVTLEYDYPGVGGKGERVTLKGDAAMRYVRRRKGASGGGDLGRMKRQQEFLLSAARQIRNRGIGAVPSIWMKCKPYVKTNLSLEQMIVLGEVLAGADLNNAKHVTLPGRTETIDGKSYFIANENGLRGVVEDIYGV